MSFRRRRNKDGEKERRRQRAQGLIINTKGCIANSGECCGPKKDRMVPYGTEAALELGTLSTNTPGQLDVLGHNRDALGMDGAQVGVLEQTDEVSLAGLLQSHDSGALEAQVSLEVLCDLTHQTLEGELADEQLGALLVTTDLPKGDGAGPVTVGFLHASGGWGALPGSLGGQLFAWGLASSRLAGGLLGTSHGCC